MRRHILRALVAVLFLGVVGGLVIPPALAGGPQTIQIIEGKFKGSTKADTYRLTYVGPMINCNAGHGLDFMFSIEGPIKIKKNSDYDRLRISGKNKSQTLRGGGVWAFNLNATKPYVCVGSFDTARYNIERDFVIWMER